ncbi:MAG: SHOCT domain-containing protein [Burkholderiales bacterium]
MFGDGFWFLGMHLLWWVFWVVLIVVVMYALSSGFRGDQKIESAREILDRRYASGEISTAEYEERRKRLEE